MKKSLLTLLLASTMILSACTNDGTTSEATTGDVAGDELTYTRYVDSDISTLNYLIEGSNKNLEVYANIIDTLVEYDKYGVVQAALAEDWSVSDDGLEWTFNIKKGIKWVDNKGKVMGDLTANDWLASAEHSLNPDNSGSSVNFMMSSYIKNAEAYADGDISDFKEVGVKVIDDHTLKYTLEMPTPYFLSLLSYGSYLPAYAPLIEELGLKYGEVDGLMDKIYSCGPYYIEEFKPNETMVLKKNPNYWDLDNVHIEKIERIYNAEALTVGPEAFLRGEVDYAEIDSALVDEWLKDPEKSKNLIKERPNNSFSYFYSFNFDPKFDAEYEPDNWKLAVHNLNFRKSLFSALHRSSALVALEPYKPETLMINTISTPEFAYADSKDFTEFGNLAKFANNDSFDKAKAIEYRDLAKAELEAAGATFPIKILVKYNPTIIGWENECVIIEQQLERDLGADYIDIIVEAGPSSDFLDNVRRNGNFAFMKCNWGADYDDPQTWIEPFSKTNSYNFVYNSEDENIKAMLSEYYALIDVASKMSLDPDYSATARFEAFANAEAILLENAIAIPYSRNQIKYVAYKLDTFVSSFAPFGIASEKFKFKEFAKEPINLEQFYKNYDAWEVERKKALEEAAASEAKKDAKLKTDASTKELETSTE